MSTKENEIIRMENLILKLKELNNDKIEILRKLLVNKGVKEVILDEVKNYYENYIYITGQDTLTRLKNRESINKYILELEEKKIEFALFFIDLDNFKVINNTLGHKFGDELLVKIGEILTEIVNKEKKSIVGRLGGDEFVIIREGKNNIRNIEFLAEKILKSINNFETQKYDLKASIGISLSTENLFKESDVFQHCDIAMYCSKRGGGNKYSIFQNEMLEPLVIEKKLKQAIKEEEFEMYLQPIYNIKNDIISGYEALIRWNDKDEIIVPDKFIYLAKKTGDIVNIDNFIFKEAVKAVKALIEKGKKDFYISINTSKLFLKQKNLIEFISNELNINNVNSKYIKMEVSEDEIIDDFKYTIDILNKLRDIGIEIYLDDFGVGYSSFGHIKALPIDLIKLDRSLILDVENNNKSKEIVKTLINLAHNLEIGVICEGIEERGQVTLLKELNCDSIQGYYFGKPLPKENYINH